MLPSQCSAIGAEPSLVPEKLTNKLNSSNQRTRSAYLTIDHEPVEKQNNNKRSTDTELATIPMQCCYNQPQAGQSLLLHFVLSFHLQTIHRHVQIMSLDFIQLHFLYHKTCLLLLVGLISLSL